MYFSSSYSLNHEINELRSSLIDHLLFRRTAGGRRQSQTIYFSDAAHQAPSGPMTFPPSRRLESARMMSAFEDYRLQNRGLASAAAHSIAPSQGGCRRTARERSRNIWRRRGDGNVVSAHACHETACRLRRPFDQLGLIESGPPCCPASWRLRAGVSREEAYVGFGQERWRRCAVAHHR